MNFKRKKKSKQNAGRNGGQIVTSAISLRCNQNTARIRALDKPYHPLMLVFDGPYYVSMC